MADFHQAHWFLKDLQYTWLDDGFKLVATTDVPCHLFCRMTTTPPRKHALPTMRRGLRMTGDVRFCFVVYEDNEQAEAGDTLTHTWLKPVWPVCQTRWFYFVGTQGGTPSVSESPIFKFHFTEVLPNLIINTYGVGVETDIPLEWPVDTPHWQAARALDDSFVYTRDYLVWRRDFYTIDPVTLNGFVRMYLKGWAADKGGGLPMRFKYALFMPGLPPWESPFFHVTRGPLWYETLTIQLDTNPVTGTDWKVSDLATLQLGVAMNMWGGLGYPAWNNVYIELEGVH